MILCSPVGSFRKQIEYFGDFRVLLDVYFPGLVDDGIPTTPWVPWGAGGQVVIPPGVLANAENILDELATKALTHPTRMADLLRVAGVATDASDPAAMAESAVSVLWYNLLATNDAMTKLGGNPFGNRWRWYPSSRVVRWLNWKVQRIDADPVALANLAPYETDGSLSVPSVGMHTTLDPIVPFSQGLQYRIETLMAGVGFGHNLIPIDRLGHCAFEPVEVLVGFAVMVLKATGLNLVAPAELLGGDAAVQEFVVRSNEAGADPRVVHGPLRH
jgi:hypothetical protein